MQPLPCKHWATLGRSANGQPKGVTVHSHCDENFDDLLQRGMVSSASYLPSYQPDDLIPKAMYAQLPTCRLDLADILAKFLRTRLTYLFLHRANEIALTNVARGEGEPVVACPVDEPVVG